MKKLRSKGNSHRTFCKDFKLINVKGYQETPNMNS